MQNTNFPELEGIETEACSSGVVIVSYTSVDVFLEFNGVEWVVLYTYENGKRIKPTFHAEELAAFQIACAAAVAGEV